MMIKSLIYDLPALLQLLLNLSSVVPMHVGHNTGREPVEFGGRYGEESRDWSHEAHVEALVRDLLGTNRCAGYLGLRRKVLLIALVKVRNHRVHLATLRLRDLDSI